jgi:hypothetical protein
MTNPPLGLERRQAALRQISLRLAALDWAPTVTGTDIDALHARMPERIPGQPLLDWLNSGLAPSHASSASSTAEVLDFVPNPRPKRRLHSRLRAMAARVDSSAPPVLLQSKATEDKRFFIDFKAVDGNIEVGIQAVGRALVILRDRDLAICAAEPDGRTVAEVRLDAAGQARFGCIDSPRMRALLMNLQIWEI